jgi:hypothetical protein
MIEMELAERRLALSMPPAHSFARRGYSQENGYLTCVGVWKEIFSAGTRIVY